MKYISLIFLLLCFKIASAHSPDFSSLMVYEQNGKIILLIKSSLTAFEGEIDYLYHKKSYKTPAEFKQLVLKHFQKNCFLILNGDTIKLINPAVILGHETTVFAELSNKLENIKSLLVKNSLFEDMPNNVCEVILTIKKMPQKQFILKNDNKHELKLRVENGNWLMEDKSNDLYGSSTFIFLSVFFVLVFVFGIVTILKTWQKSKKSL